MTTAESIDVPDRIMEEATRLFVTRGYHGISMREIAEAVGVSKAGLYYHFKDKEDLFIAILTTNLNQIDHIHHARRARPARRRANKSARSSRRFWASASPASDYPAGQSRDGAPKPNGPRTV